MSPHGIHPPPAQGNPYFAAAERAAATARTLKARRKWGKPAVAPQPLVAASSLLAQWMAGPEGWETLAPSSQPHPSVPHPSRSWRRVGSLKSLPAQPRVPHPSAAPSRKGGRPQPVFLRLPALPTQSLYDGLE